MRATLFVSLIAVVLAASATGGAYAQQSVISPAANACGPGTANFVVTHAAGQTAMQTIPAGKALVYVIESMFDYPFVTKKVDVGLDGTWIGATDAQSHMGFLVEPGVHHLCAVYQGHAASMDAEGHTLLLHLNAEAGKTYYLRYHAFFSKDAGGIAFFEPVDEDEGLLLLQQTAQAASRLKQ